MEKRLIRSTTFTVHCAGTDASRVFRCVNEHNVITTEHVAQTYRNVLRTKGYKLADLAGLGIDTLSDMLKRHKKWTPFMMKGGLSK